jgi:hypothetical protein
VLFVSRLFLWPAFPRTSRIAWAVFWDAQILLFAPTVTSAVIWATITFGLFAFVFISDTVLLYRGYRISHANNNEAPR